jgi:hypothetical protein
MIGGQRASKHCCSDQREGVCNQGLIIVIHVFSLYYSFLFLFYDHLGLSSLYGSNSNNYSSIFVVEFPIDFSYGTYLNLLSITVYKLSVNYHVLGTDTFNFSDTDVMNGTPFRTIWGSYSTTLFVNKIVRKSSHLFCYDADQK